MTDPVLKIEGYAFDKFLFMRDHKDCEVTMFGVTKPEDPLHVTDFKLVRQVVNSVSSDCDPDYMAEYNEKMYMDHKILPLNCERVWCHTHPMTGETSANPSGKDMNTWNDKDNALKQFYVMMILSKSNHITCKLRIKTNLDKAVPGIDIPIVYEKDIKVEILKSDIYDKHIEASLGEIFGKVCVDKLGANAVKVLRPLVSLIEIYPEFQDLVTEYDKLVSKETPRTYNNTNQHYNAKGSWPYKGNDNNSFLKEKNEPVTGEKIPEILLRINEHRISSCNLQEMDFTIIRSAFDFEGQKDFDVAQKDFDSIRNEKTNVVNVFLGAISANILTVRGGVTSIDSKSSMLNKRCRAVNFAKLPFPEYHGVALEINRCFLDKVTK